MKHELITFVNSWTTVRRLNFAGLHFTEIFFANTPHPHNGLGVLHSKTPPMSAELLPLHWCVVFCDSLPNFNVLSVCFSDTYLGVPLTFAGSSWQLHGIAHVGTSWENSPCGPGSLHFDYCPSSLLKYTNRAIKL